MNNLLLGVTGSVGASMTVDMCRCFSRHFNVRLVASHASLSFFNRVEAEAICPVLTDEAEWYTWRKTGDPILHIDLRNWSDVFIVAPMTANTLSKFSEGRCDNLLSTVFRAWQCSSKPIFVCPSMNTYMWEHPITEMQLQRLKSWSITVIPPAVTWLAGGDFGPAALPPPETLLRHLMAFPS